jgi:hypothetical protein
MTDLNELQKKLKAIADTVNAFKSESVQLRVVEVLLGQLGVADSAAPAASEPSRPRRKRRPPKRAGSSGTKNAKPKRKPSRAPGSPGAFAMISQLLTDSFFKTPKTIGSIVEHCRTSRGHHYKASECSPALLRLLRDKKLKRQKNKEGQYEYSQA